MRCSSSTLASLPVAPKSTVASSFASAADWTSTQPSPHPQNPIQTYCTSPTTTTWADSTWDPSRRSSRRGFKESPSENTTATCSATSPVTSKSSGLQLVAKTDREHDYLFVVGVCMCCVPACLVGVCAIACVYLLQDTQGRHFRDDHNSARWSQMVTSTFQRRSGVNIGQNTLRAAFLTYLQGTDCTDDTHGLSPRMLPEFAAAMRLNM